MINFVEVEKSVRELKQQFADGQIDQSTFESRLLAMIDVAEDGYYWMFGHKSERWFRYDGGEWVAEDPEERLVFLYEQKQLYDSSPNKSQPHQDQETAAEPPPEPAGQSIDLGWFVVSLILLVAIGWIVYYSSLLV